MKNDNDNAKKIQGKPSLQPPDVAQKIDEAITEFIGKNPSDEEAKAFIKNLSEQTKYSVHLLTACYQQKIGDNNPDNAKDKKLTDKLLALVDEQKCELFHDANKEAYARIPVDEHSETLKIKSTSFKRWLRSLFYRDSQRGLSAQVLTDVLETLDAKAVCEGPEYKVYMRIAHIGGEIWIDLCNDKWQVIHITANDWAIVDKSPVRFIRSPGMLPQVIPLKGGIASEKIGKLRNFINVDNGNNDDADNSDDNWRLIIAWLVGAFSPGPYTVLIILGEQGCGKTFLCNICRSVVDPSEIPHVTTVKESRDIVMAAQNSHVVVMNNLSKLPDWLSDLLCSITGGATHRERKYHTNSGDEVLFKPGAKPIILNGIDFAMRGDLVDRGLLVSLKEIEGADRKEESELLPQIEQAMPEIFGGICDVLVSILKNLPTTKLNFKPRMADFATWVTAAESVLGWEAGAFMQTYTRSRKDAVDLTIESDSFGAALRGHMESCRNWSGNWKELITVLAGDNEPPKDWPKNGKAVAGIMQRLRPAMRQIGIIYDDAKHVRTGSIYSIKKNLSQPSHLSQDNAGETLNGDRCVTNKLDGDGYNQLVKDSILAQMENVTVRAAAAEVGDTCDTCEGFLLNKDNLRRVII